MQKTLASAVLRLAGRRTETLVEGLEEMYELERRRVNPRDGAAYLSERHLKKRIGNLLKKYRNLELEVVMVNEIDHPVRMADWKRRGTMGSFKQGPPPMIFLREGEVTELTLQHEIWHLEDLKKLGADQYRAKANWEHEESVWNKIWQNRHDKKWTQQ